MDENIKTNNPEAPAENDGKTENIPSAVSAMADVSDSGLVADTVFSDEPFLMTAEAEPVVAVVGTGAAGTAEGHLAAIKRKRNNGLGTIINVLLICVIGILVFLLVFMNLFILCPVSQTSMLPQIQDGQRVLLFKTQDIKRQDIFVFQSNEIDTKTGQNKNLIKRAIAIGGDRLLFVAFGESKSDAEIFVYLDTGSGFELLKEDYLNREEEYKNKPMVFDKMWESSDMVYFASEDFTPEDFEVNVAAEAGLLDVNIIKIPENTYFAMGDNRNVSKDSRSFGSVKKDAVIGRCSLKLTQDSFLEKLMRFLYRDN